MTLKKELTNKIAGALLHDPEIKNEVYHLLKSFSEGSNSETNNTSPELLDSMGNVFDSVLYEQEENKPKPVEFTIENFAPVISSKTKMFVQNEVRKELVIKQDSLTMEEVRQSTNKAKQKVKQYIKALDTFFKIRVSDYYDLDNQKTTNKNLDKQLTVNAQLNFRSRVYAVKKLETLLELSPILSQCISAMVDNVIGKGFNIVETYDKKENVEKGTKAEIEQEKEYIQSILDNANTLESLLEVLEKCYKDYQEYGEFYVKVRHVPINSRKRVENQELMLADVVHIPANQVLILKNVVQAEVTNKIDRGYSTINFNTKRDYKIYCHLRPIYRQEISQEQKEQQKIHTRNLNDKASYELNYYSEFGCPYKVNSMTGIPELEETNENEYTVYHYRDFNASTSYGKPLWISKLTAIISQIEAQALNLDSFSNSLIPNVLMLLNDIQPNNADIKHFQQSMRRKQPHEQRQANKVVFLKSLSSKVLDKIKQLEGSNPTAGRNGNIEIIKLNDVERKELLFGESDERWSNTIRSAFKIPPLLIGLTQDYTRATARESLETAEEQVFSQERNYLEDFIENVLFAKALDSTGLKYHKIKLNVSSVADKMEEAEFISKLIPTGSVTPQMGLDLINKHTYNDYEKADHVDKEYYSTPIENKVGTHENADTIQDLEVDDEEDNNQENNKQTKKEE